MSVSLPSPGGDNGTWGTMLNSYITNFTDGNGNLLTASVSAAGAEMTTNKNQPSGYAGLNSASLVAASYLGTGTANSSTFLTGANTWVSVPGASNATSSTPGLIQLDGDLGGSATSPTVAQIQGVAVTAADATLVAELNNTTVRNTSGLPVTASAGEETVLIGSTSGGTFTLPTSPQNSTINMILNSSSVNVVLAAGGSNTLANNLGKTGSIQLMPGDSYVVVYAASTSTWYIQQTNTTGKTVLNAVAYGADPTGVNDSTAAIQAAINDLPASGGEVYLPAGTYLAETISIGNATTNETAIASGSSGSTLSVTSTSGFSSPSGTLAVYTAQLTATKVTYTGISGNTFTGCSTLPALTVGNAVTQGTVSSTNGITLRGEGMASVSVSGFVGYSANSTTIKYNGAATGAMLYIKGPISGVRLENLYLNAIGTHTAGVGVDVIAGLGCRFQNVFVAGASEQGWFSSGVNGFYVGNQLIIGTTIASVWDNVGAFVPATPGAVGMYFNGDVTGNSLGSSNTTYCNVSNVYLSVSDPGVTSGTVNQNYGLYFGFSDNITVRNTNIIIPATANGLGTGTSSTGGRVYGVLYDYGQQTSHASPGAIIVDGINNGEGVGLWYAANSSGAGAFDINVAKNIKGGSSNGSGNGPAYADPGIYNLKWEAVGGASVLSNQVTANTLFTSATARQMDPVRDVFLYILETSTISWEIQMGPSSTMTTTLMPSQNPGAKSMCTFYIPAGWWVMITCATLTDLTMTVVTVP